MSRWVFEIENEFETFEVKPKGLDNKLRWEREDDRLFDFTKTIGDLLFTGEDFQKFLDYEQNYHCTENTLRIYQMCGLVRQLRFESKFSMSSGKWNLDKCTVQFKLDEVDKYLCVKRKREYDIFDLIKPSEQISLGAMISFDMHWCRLHGQTNENVCDEDWIIDNHYGLYDTYEVSNNTFFYYLRLTIRVPQGTVVTGWHQVPTDFPGMWKFVTEYIDEEHRDLFHNQNGVIDFVQGTMEVTALTSIKNGFRLHDVLTELLQANCPDMKIVSDFFQWNPVNPSTINYVTGKATQINYLKIFQKSDIKRPNATNSATKAETNFMKLFSDILRIFNCGYYVDGNILRVEHISWFEKNQNLNLVQIAKATGQTTLGGTRKYSYDKTKLPKYEYFEWMDESSEEFAGTPIWYDNGCVEDDDDLIESLTNRVENVTTDLLHCFVNSSAGSSEVTDAGFVIVATDNMNKVIWLPNILDSGTLPNNVLSWPYLHRDFWKHGRVQIVGYMNTPIDEEEPSGTLFLSSIPVKDQDPFVIRLCCDQISEFNPLDLQNSTMGWGEVKSAELSLNTDMMQFELMFKQT